MQGEQIIQSSDRGFKCTKCGTWHAYTPYVIAHRREHILHTCDHNDCGATHIIQAEKQPRNILQLDARDLL